MQKLIATFLLLITCFTGRCQLAAPTAISDAGYSSCSIHSCLFVPDDQQAKEYRHGDLIYTVREDGTFTLSRGRETLLSTHLENLSASVFVTWSRRDDWLAITWSDGGAIGKFHTRVFNVADKAVTEFASASTAFGEFKSRHWCRTRGDNLQAYGWDGKTGALVLVASVYPTSDCGKDLGHTEAYLVRPLNGAIYKHMTLREFNVYAKLHPR